VLVEVLGEPQSDDSGLDKSSTHFLWNWEDETVSVFDFHKPEWGEPPECLTDVKYVWSVEADGADVAPFCAWLSGEVMKRLPDAGDVYAWPLPGDPFPTPVRAHRPPVRAVPPLVRQRKQQASLPPLEAHRRRVLTLQDLLEGATSDSDLSLEFAKLSGSAQSLVQLIAREPELDEPALRERFGPSFDTARAELDAFLKRQRSPT
jgi:hypothetical protein